VDQDGIRKEMMMKILKLITALATSFTLGQANVQINTQDLDNVGGHMVAMSKDTVIVGDSSTNSVHFYDLDYSTFKWSLAQIMSGTLDKVSLLGTSVAIDGDFAIAGAPQGSNAQHFYTFQGGTTTWSGAQTRTFLRYSVVSDEWEKKHDALAGVSYGGALAAVGNKVYALRGDGKKDFWYYDTVNDDWHTLQDIPANGGGIPFVWSYASGVYGGGALVYDGDHYLYATRGVLKESTFVVLPSVDYSTKLYRYDLNTGQWSTISMPSGVGAAFGTSLVAANGYIYMTKGTKTGFFGIGLGSGSKEFFRYDPSTGNWAAAQNLPEEVGHGGTLSYHAGKIYAFVGKTGGTNSSGSIKNHVYDIATNSWGPMPDLPNEADEGASMIFAGEDLYALRGQGTSDFLQFDFSQNTWNTLPNPVGGPSGSYNISGGGSLATAYISRPEAALVFHRQGGTWSKVLKIESPNQPENVRFGKAVGIKDNKDGTAEIFVGAPESNNTVTEEGVVYAYHYAPGNSSATQTILGSGEVQGHFGTAIDIKGDFAIIGEPDANSLQGRAHTYRWVSPSWTLFPTSNIIEQTPSSHRGTKVAIDTVYAITAGIEDLNDADSISTIHYNGQQHWTYPYNAVLHGGGVDVDDHVFMMSNLETGILFPYLITGEKIAEYNNSALGVKAFSAASIYKETAITNAPANSRAIAIDVPCGLKPTHLVENVWAMISAPCGNNADNTGATIDEIFGDEMTAAGATQYCQPSDTTCNWVMYKDGPDYTGKSSDNVRMSENDPMVLGQGYWIIADQNVTLKADANAITTRTLLDTTNANATIAGFYKSFILPGNLGHDAKIMVGNPFPRVIKWKDVTQSGNGGQVPINGGTGYEFLNPTGYVYDTTQTGSTGQPYRAITATGTPGINGEIKPYQGVWIKKVLDAVVTGTIDFPFEK